MLLFQKKVSLFIPRSSFFFVIHVSVDIKTQWEKDIVVVFFYISPGGHAISRQKLRIPFGLPYLLIQLFFIELPVVWTDARAGERTVTWLPKFIGCIDNQLFLPMMLWRARERRYYLFTGLQSLDALTTRMLEFSSKFQLSTSMSMWAQSSFSGNISCSNLIMAIALPSVWPLNVPRTTSPFSTIYQAFLIL